MKDGFPDRAPRYQRNDTLESVLETLNAALAPGAGTLIEDGGQPDGPVGLIVGNPRSGTTLLLQWLGYNGYFSYPTNLISRFYAAPAAGALVQKMLCDPALRYKDELAEEIAVPDYSSDLGKTAGLLGANPFWYFWRRFFPSEPTNHIPPNRWPADKARRFAAEIASLEAALARPFAMKALYLNWNIAELAGALPNSLFFHVTREPVFAVQSLLEARRRFNGDAAAWWGMKPPQYAELLGKEAVEQAAATVRLTDLAIEDALDRAPARNVFRVRYETLCEQPETVFESLKSHLRDHFGYALPDAYAGPARFDHTRDIRLSPEEIRRFEAEWALHDRAAMQGAA